MHTTMQEMQMASMADADLARARRLPMVGLPRVSGHQPCTGIGHVLLGAPSVSWTTANAVTTKALKAFGAYGAPRSEELST